MVGSGCRPGQVLSSGKHTGPAKLTNGKRGTRLRKISRFNADFGNAIHSDSESQTETVQGLDGCASLLRDILRNEDSVSSGNKKRIPNEASAGSERDSSDIPQNWSLQDHYRMYSPIIYQALCEHVQTQMSLMNELASKNNSNGIPAVPYHTMSGSESQATLHSSYGLSSSTPVQLLQHPSCLPMVDSEVQTDGDNQFASQGKAVSMNCTDILQSSISTGLGVPSSLSRTDKPAIPSFQQLGLVNGILPQQEVPKEPDLLKCFQTYMNLLHSYPASQTHRSPTLLPPASLSNNEDKCTKEQIAEVTSEGKDLNIHMRDLRIKDVQKAKNVNQSAEKARTIKYLLGELKALLAEQEDSEIQRLITELDACISLLPAISGNTNIQVEIALAMQPLRSENAQLRRQLRILNRQLREQEKTQKASGALECNLELFSLQSLNKSLQNQLQESLKSQELLQNKNEELLKVIENQKDENKKFAGMFKEKDQTLLENKQQFDIETTRIKIELEEALVNLKSSQFKLEAAEKENQILGITLRQRDAEVTRLRELTRTLQSSMARLLSDLSMDSARCKSGNLTKALLNIYEKQPQHDPIPAHTSIMSYLSKLETDHNFTHSEPLSAVNTEENIEPDRPYENALPSKGPQQSNTKSMEEASAPGIIPTLSKQDLVEDSEITTLIDDGCNLDNTIYIPFARSTSKKKSPLSKRLSPQPQITVASPQLVGNSGCVSEKENKSCAPGVGSSSKKEAEDAPEKLPRTADMKDKQLLKKIKEAICKIPAAPEEPPELAAGHGPSTCQSSSFQVRSSAVSDGSFLNSDLMSDWSISSFSTFTSRDEQDFRNGLAALDANIARLQKSLRTGLLEK
ncbi:coiled-coil domain-containing protein 14 isoform X2 [Canis lupus familiaris]|uniref:Coiled-coil domain containing 14 n=1 Tax=Canis lupus familiaris TaxID=9615 RepID=A0A8P0NQT5_CANLF|nr:coiled-coil domain-containing protein 14 isoform X2 [Canis lupus dingo]XP_038318360.1 coiled-coil domain-containing protein 14 isoform X2 [Canis lupus familiaris]XP_038438986.1 coiled-coil domain-containing protein 14 isoform X2 [Canis lupus familiaris]